MNYQNGIGGAAAASVVATQPTPQRYARIEQWATEQSRRLVLQALADMAYAAVERAAALAYEELPGVGRINLYPDGRFRQTVPWGKHAGAWGLNRTHRELVRALLLAAQRTFDNGKSDRPPLYFYDSDRRRWLCNIGDYPSQAAALTWLAWAQQNWTPATVETALRWLEKHAPDGRKRGAATGAPVGHHRALG